MNENSSAPSMVSSIVAGVVAAALGPVLWVGSFKVNAIWLGAVGIGVLVGLAMRLVGASNDRRLQAIAALLAVLSCIVGYLVTDLAVIVWVDQSGQPVQPGFGDALGRLVADITAIVFMAIGAYLAYLLAHRAPSATAPQ